MRSRRDGRGTDGSGRRWLGLPFRSLVRSGQIFRCQGLEQLAEQYASHGHSPTVWKNQRRRDFKLERRPKCVAQLSLDC